MSAENAGYRELRFTLEISTELDEGDEAAPTIDYVRDWLTAQGYDSVLVEGYPEECPECGRTSYTGCGNAWHDSVSPLTAYQEGFADGQAIALRSIRAPDRDKS